MALLNCEDCRHEVSSLALACPYCGRPVRPAPPPVPPVPRVIAPPIPPPPPPPPMPRYVQQPVAPVYFYQEAPRRASAKLHLLLAVIVATLIVGILAASILANAQPWASGSKDALDRTLEAVSAFILGWIATVGAIFLLIRYPAARKIAAVLLIVPLIYGVLVAFAGTRRYE